MVARGGAILATLEAPPSAFATAGSSQGRATAGTRRRRRRPSAPRGPSTCVTAARRETITALEARSQALEGASARLAAANAALRRAELAKTWVLGSASALRHVHPTGNGGGGGGGSGGNSDEALQKDEDQKEEDKKKRQGQQQEQPPQQLRPRPVPAPLVSAPTTPQPQQQQQQHICSPEYNTTLQTWQCAVDTALRLVSNDGPVGRPSPPPSPPPPAAAAAAAAEPNAPPVPDTTQHGDRLALLRLGSGGSDGCKDEEEGQQGRRGGGGISEDGGGGARPSLPQLSPDPTPVHQDIDAMIRASVLGQFLPSPLTPQLKQQQQQQQQSAEVPSLSAAAAPASSSPWPSLAPTLIESAAAGLGAEVARREAEMRSMTLAEFGERIRSIVAHASLELKRQACATQEEDGACNDDGDDDDDDHDHKAALCAALAREWLALIVASSKYAPKLVEMMERYDLRRRQLVMVVAGGDVAAWGEEQTDNAFLEDAAFERRSRRALQAARLTPQQRQALADAFRFFLAETRAPVSDWRRAAGQIDAWATTGGGGGLAPAADTALAALGNAVARCLASRSVFYMSVIGTVTPPQLLRAAIAVYPLPFRPANLAWACHRYEAGDASAAADEARACLPFFTLFHLSAPLSFGAGPPFAPPPPHQTLLVGRMLRRHL